MSVSPLANPTATKDVLNRFGLNAKYSLGQNFLVDDNVIGRIVRMAGLEEAQDESILEIGPGIGTLTVALLDHGSVVSVERDKDLLPVLAETTAFHSDRFAVVNMDALKCQKSDIEAAFSSLNAPLPTKLVANLPYAIAATVILDWFQRFDFLQEMIVMVQSEVADRIAASVGTKDYAAYSIKLRMLAQTQGRFQVSRNCFHPAPRVESAVVHLVRNPLCEDSNLIEAASKMAEAAFAQRRKNVRNSMKASMDAHFVDELLATCGIAPTVRGETLSVEQFIQLGKAYLELA